MATNNNIHSYTAADIEKYHKGLLSNQEMHNLEKAALEDPFLADALEGFAVPGVQLADDVAGLRKRLEDKLSRDDAKVVSMGGNPKTGFPWFRVAAAVVILAGAGLLANQFLFTKKETGIAEVKPAADKAKENKTSKQPGFSDTAPPAGMEEAKTDQAASPNPQLSIKDNETSSNGPVSTTGGSQPVVSAEKQFNTDQNTGKLDERPVTTGEVETKDMARAEAEKKKPEPAVNVVDDKLKDKDFTDAKAKNIASAPPGNSNVALSRKKVENDSFHEQRPNIFRGRVTDANNVGVPFANVTNVEDKVGTYTDANGYFNLTSPDSALTVQVRSIGFENNQVQLKNNLPTNRVVLQDDRRNLTEVVINNQRRDAAFNTRANQANNNQSLEEPEPSVGWTYYNTYAANNLEIPEEIKTRQSPGGSVEVSFEVGANGEPVDIRIEKSLCTKCDQEAIRLIKDGPKWKRAANKKGRTTITINF